MGHTKQLLHKTTPSRLREVAILPDTYRQTQRGRENEQTKKYISNQRKGESLEKDLTEMEISNLPDKEFKVTVIMMLFIDLGRRMEEHSKNFNKEIENIRKHQLKL